MAVGLNPATDTKGRVYYNGSAGQILQQCPQCAFPRWLTSNFFGPSTSPKEQPKGRIVEQRVVSETSGATRFTKDFAFHFAAKRPARFTAFSQCNHTHEPARARFELSPNRSSNKRLLAPS